MSVPTLPRRAGDLVFGGHLVLAVSMCAWRVFESLPGLSAEDGGRFTTSQAGRLGALATLLLAGAAALGATLQGARCWRDPRVALLSIAFVLALSSRQRVDVFDLVYVALAVALAAWWFKSERALAPSREPGER